MIFSDCSRANRERQGASRWLPMQSLQQKIQVWNENIQDIFVEYWENPERNYSTKLKRQILPLRNNHDKGEYPARGSFICHWANEHGKVLLLIYTSHCPISSYEWWYWFIKSKRSRQGGASPSLPWSFAGFADPVHKSPQCIPSNDIKCKWALNNEEAGFLSEEILSLPF